MTTSVRVVLRPVSPSDVDNLMTWVNDPGVVGNLATFSHQFTREDEEKYVAGILSSDVDKVFSVENESGQYIGQAGLHEIEWRNKKARASLVIKKEFQGNGYGQEAIQELLRKAFYENDFHKVYLIVDRDNKKNQHIYGKVGFIPEGILFDEYFRNGEYRDMIRMCMLSEWFDKERGAKR